MTFWLAKTMGFCYFWIQPFPKQQILHSSKLKEFEDNNFKFVENGKKPFKRVENTEGSGEIARYEQFLLFPRCFQKTCTAVQKGIVWESVKKKCWSISQRMCELFPKQQILCFSKLEEFCRRQFKIWWILCV